MPDWRDYQKPEKSEFLQSYLRESPELAYYSAKPFGAGYTHDEMPLAKAANPWGASQFDVEGRQVQGGYSPAQQQYWSSQYGNVRNQFLGEMGRQLKEGQTPSMSFSDYLEKYPWTQRYTSLGPSMRPGARQSRFAPAARYMY